MLAIIETKNATHITINVPVDAATEMLPALAKLFESNSTFYYNNMYSGVEVVEPKITFQLGNTYEFPYSQTTVVVTTEGVPATFTGEFEGINPEAFANFNKVLAEKNAVISDANTTIKYLKARLVKVEQEVEAFRQLKVNYDALS